MIVLLGIVSHAYAQTPAVMISDKAGWHKISEVSVNFKTETDEIVVSKVIDLKGYESELKKVVFVYHTIKGSSSEKAHVELYGLK